MHVIAPQDFVSRTLLFKNSSTSNGRKYGNPKMPWIKDVRSPKGFVECHQTFSKLLELVIAMLAH